MIDEISSLISGFTGWVNSVSGGNEFVAGSMILVFWSWIYYAKSFPKKILNFIMRKVTMHANISNMDFPDSPDIKDVFVPIIQWHESNWFYRFVRMREYVQYLDTYFPLGSYWIVDNLKIYRISYSTKSKESVGNAKGMINKELIIHITKLGIGNSDSLTNEIDNIIEVGKAKTVIPRLYELDGGLSFIKKERRLTSKRIVPTKTNNYIENIITTFINKKEWYVEKSLPYKESMILYGESGTGKTSIVRKIMNDNKLHLVNIRPNDILSRMEVVRRMIDSSIYYSQGIPVVILIEDIDTVSVVKSREDGSNNDRNESSSLSDVLNLLDGVEELENVIVVLTTNHIKVLDEALIRNGRINHKIEMKRYTPEESQLFVDTFYGEGYYLETGDKEFKIADLSACCIKNPEDFDGFVKDLKEIK